MAPCRVVMVAIVSPGYVSLYSGPGMQAPAGHLMSAVHHGISYIRYPALFVHCAVISDQMVDAVDTMLHETQ